MNTNNAFSEQPDLVLHFGLGDYSHALRCYERAKQWATETGLVFRSDVYGRILRPQHPQSPWEEEVAPEDLLDDPNWTLCVQLFASNEAILNELKDLTLPENSTLTVCEKE